ncbi:MAG: hypothetical protein IPM54_41890 [Polyangiaceae bacterium]|nr:hypothetical protein [Polyangiaceae bacterium]
MRLTKTSLVVVSLLSLMIAARAEARPFRVDDIPNGSKFTCLNCHGDLKASYNTDFGSDARNFLIPVGAVSTQHVDWTPLCALDSDRDGWTNGQELGDPDCVWKPGDPDPKGFLTNPGVYESAPPPVCGNGVLEANEACDGTLFAETNCAFVGAGEGMLGCTADCEFDYGGCSTPPDGPPNPNESGGGDASIEGGCSMSSAGASDASGWGLFVVVGMGLAARRRRVRVRGRVG